MLRVEFSFRAKLTEVWFGVCFWNKAQSSFSHRGNNQSTITERALECSAWCSSLEKHSVPFWQIQEMRDGETFDCVYTLKLLSWNSGWFLEVWFFFLNLCCGWTCSKKSYCCRNELQRIKTSTGFTHDLQIYCMLDCCNSLCFKTNIFHSCPQRMSWRFFYQWEKRAGGTEASRLCCDRYVSFPELNSHHLLLSEGNVL